VHAEDARLRRVEDRRRHQRAEDTAVRDRERAAREIVGIASAGLIRRNVLNDKGEDESIYLAPLEEIIQRDETRAEYWLKKYRGEWGGDLTRIFSEAEM
jgi:glutamate--cysteine ligase